MLAACQLLDHMGDTERAARVKGAIEQTLRERKTLTADVGGTATTDQFTAAVIDNLGPP
jgi:isocitrate dehydrogenase (NAD+)